MPSSNLYATLAEYKAENTARGQSASTDAADDAVITLVLEQVSRYVDGITGRQFYPSYETRLYDIPRYPAPSKDVKLGKDLLEVVSFLNGDATVISSSNYTLRSPNITPYWQISLKDTATVSWAYPASGSREQILSLTGWWGYRENYSQRGWVLATTLTEDLDTSETAWDVASIALLPAGAIGKVDNEIFNISSSASLTANVNKRGDNGSTAATHSSGASVYVWSVQEEIKRAVLMTAQGVNAFRNGQSTTGKITITAAGMVIRPEEVPPMAKEIFNSFKAAM